jgi:hypothetical protein
MPSSFADRSFAVPALSSSPSAGVRGKSKVTLVLEDAILDIIEERWRRSERSIARAISSVSASARSA